MTTATSPTALPNTSSVKFPPGPAPIKGIVNQLKLFSGIQGNNINFFRPLFEQYGDFVTLQIGDEVLQGSDSPPGQFTKAGGFAVALHFGDAAEGERVFEALAQGGTVQMPYQATFWAKGFGMVLDRFGTPWIVNADQQIG